MCYVGVGVDVEYQLFVKTIKDSFERERNKKSKIENLAARNSINYKTGWATQPQYLRDSWIEACAKTAPSCSVHGQMSDQWFRSAIVKSQTHMWKRHRDGDIELKFIKAIRLAMEMVGGSGVGLVERDYVGGFSTRLLLESRVGNQ